MLYINFIVTRKPKTCNRYTHTQINTQKRKNNLNIMLKIVIKSQGKRPKAGRIGRYFRAMTTKEWAGSSKRDIPG